ncbi:hypothetical protein [Bradyrhizobium roseum]|uniref:hypothetical protein n=1 Tax=Bradyrhizobium roseum TaxID=3056648 RepID=UPI002618F6D5|nr:hypothetical protein [Bradyrhizobium roseus]WKA30471.1 hypothetical protein QUH67_10040 [Bradyrhizobium roseus]
MNEPALESDEKRSQKVANTIESSVGGGSVDVALPTDRTTMQHCTEWLKRQGATDTSYAFVPHNSAKYGARPAEQSSWWIDYGNFQRGVGALGGGNVDINAGGDLDNLTVAMPTNGRVRGGRTVAEQKTLEVRNGGALTVEAGGAVRAGYYYLGRGAGTIEAGEFAVGREVRVTSGSQVTTYPIAPILSLGDATLDVRTAGDLRLQTFLDPLLVSSGDPYAPNFISSHTERTALSPRLDRRRRHSGQSGHLPVEGCGSNIRQFYGRCYPFYQ